MSDYAEIVISQFSVSGQAVQYGATAEIAIASTVNGIGGFGVSGFCGSSAEVPMSGVAVDGTSFSGTRGEIAISAFGAEGIAGSVAESAISLFSVLGKTSLPIIGGIPISSFAVDGTAKIGILSQGFIDIVKMSVSGRSSIGVLGQGDLAFRMRVDGTAMVGGQGECFIAFPPFAVDGTALAGVLAHGDFVMSCFDVHGQAVDPSEFSAALAYNKDALQ